METSTQNVILFRSMLLEISNTCRNTRTFPSFLESELVTPGALRYFADVLKTRSSAEGNCSAMFCRASVATPVHLEWATRSPPPPRPTAGCTAHWWTSHNNARHRFSRWKFCALTCLYRALRTQHVPTDFARKTKLRRRAIRDAIHFPAPGAATTTSK